MILSTLYSRYMKWGIPTTAAFELHLHDKYHNIYVKHLYLQVCCILERGILKDIYPGGWQDMYAKYKPSGKYHFRRAYRERAGSSPILGGINMLHPSRYGPITRPNMQPGLLIAKSGMVVAAMCQTRDLQIRWQFSFFMSAVYKAELYNSSLQKEFIRKSIHDICPSCTLRWVTSADNSVLWNISDGTI